MSLRLDTDFDPEVGRFEQLTPLVARIVADNPGPFTFRGTGVYVIGVDDVAIIDPGPDDDAHVDRLLTALEGRSVSHILVTHTHRDHSPAAAAVSAATGAPTHGFGPHPPDDRRDAGDGEEPGDVDFVPDEAIGDGDVINGDGWTLDVIHTPGHISNHLCFALRQERSVFTGDHIMGWSTTVIPPPDGDMAAYLRSLQLFLDRADERHWPTHGPAITEPLHHVQALIEHRVEREQQIVGQLDRGVTEVPDMVAALYPGLDERLRRAAGQSVLAHLIALVGDGRARCEGELTVEGRFVSCSRSRPIG